MAGRDVQDDGVFAFQMTVEEVVPDVYEFAPFSVWGFLGDTDSGETIDIERSGYILYVYES